MKGKEISPSPFFVFLKLWIIICVLFCVWKSIFGYKLYRLPNGYISVSRNGEEQKKPSVRNPYFYQNQEKVVEYEGYFYLHTYVGIWQNINLNIKKLGTFEHGTLYTLKLDQLDRSDPDERLGWQQRCMGYFYVTEDIIYMYRDREFSRKQNRKIKWTLQRDDEEFLKKAWTVCCEEEIDKRDNDDERYHSFVNAKGNWIIYRYIPEDSARGMPEFTGSKSYWLIVWEKGNGIVYWETGRGGMDMHVEFGVDLKEKQKIDYGYPFKRIHYDEIAEGEAERMSEKTEEIEKEEIQENQE